MAEMAWEAKREVHLGGPRRFTKTITTRMKKMQKLKKMQKNEEAQRSEEEEAYDVGEREARVILKKNVEGLKGLFPTIARCTSKTAGCT